MLFKCNLASNHHGASLAKHDLLLATSTEFHSYCSWTWGKWQGKDSNVLGLRESCFSSETGEMSVLNPSYFSEIQFSVTNVALKKECTWKSEPGMLTSIYKMPRRWMLSVPLLLANVPFSLQQEQTLATGARLCTQRALQRIQIAAYSSLQRLKKMAVNSHAQE